MGGGRGRGGSKRAGEGRASGKGRGWKRLEFQSGVPSQYSYNHFQPVLRPTPSPSIPFHSTPHLSKTKVYMSSNSSTTKTIYDSTPKHALETKM